MTTNNSAHVLPPRCLYRSSHGRQCRSRVAAPGQTFCARHSASQSPDSVDFTYELIEGYGNFQRAQNINYSLIELYKLVAKGRISPRRAAVLAYIASFILRTFKAIDYDQDRLVPEKENADATAAPPHNPIAPGIEPLPRTGAEFAEQVLNRFAESQRPKAVANVEPHSATSSSPVPEPHSPEATP